jgi:predicted glycoside hydrolase/deacetylase ChbG (UPF0249 family)
MSQLKNKLLIVTADDYGVTSEVSEGIRNSIENGIVSCTSVMMNFVSQKDIDSLLELKTKKHFGIGLHINLTEGKSVATGQTFEFLMLNQLDFIHTEINCQVERFKNIFGEIDHINFHQHIHYDLRVLQEYLSISELKEVPLRFVNKLMKEILSSYRRNIPDVFVNVFPFKANQIDFQTYLDKSVNDFLNYKNGITEWMVHPGYSSLELEKLAPNYSKRREEESRLLCGEGIKGAFKKNDIACKTFKECF